MDLFKLVQSGIEKKASDIHITVGLPIIFRINGELVKFGDVNLNPQDTEKIAKIMLNEKQFNELEQKGEIDISYSSPGLGRFRVNIYRQRGSYGIAIRIIPLKIPTLEELG
ncbi:MAG: hypothetical protein WCY24_08615, partial [Lutispora sp.]